MQDIASFLINLDRDTVRLETSSRLLAGASIRFERIKAVLGINADQTPAAGAMKATGRSLNPGEIGCFLSHRAAAQAFLDTDKPLGLVLEDDVAVTPNSRATLNEFADVFTNLPNWSVVNLARPAKHHYTQLSSDQWSYSSPLYRAHYMPVTTTALLWNRTGAAEFLKRTETFVYPIDVFIQRWVAEADCGLAFLAPPFGSREDDSTIGGTRSSGSNPFSKAQRHRIWRMISTHQAAKRHKKNAL